MLTEHTKEFDSWLSPDVVSFLIRTYAGNSEFLGTLKWKYEELDPNRWGEYVPITQILYVNNKKTEGLFKKQVETLLHEIQHWNQHIEFIAQLEAYRDVGGEIPEIERIDLGIIFSKAYQNETKKRG